jgi:crotonobetainyl-CoA:carnitine CoA-transferase CaiB-like acyl-CoA transferase
MLQPPSTRCLQGLRVLELTRVLAGPIAGRTLAAHGADVLWITSPRLPDLPALDKDTARGKRSIQLDLNDPDDMTRLRALVKEADVFLQSYRPTSLAARGLSPEELVKLNPNIIIANLSAFGTAGPWNERRGFDSLVQTCSGMNVSEASYFGHPNGAEAKPMPCQALDHASGYFLATGIAAAVYRRAKEGGAWRVDVSLAGTMKWLRSLGQMKPVGKEGEGGIVPRDEEVGGESMEERESGFGILRAVRHAARVEDREVGWVRMPGLLGGDEVKWL